MPFLAALGALALLVLVSAGVLLAREWFRPGAPAAPPPSEAARRARLLAPRWDRVEAGLGRPVPAVLRALYADAGLVTASDVRLVQPLDGRGARLWEVDGFVPADEEALRGDAHAYPPGSFIFASNGTGGLYYFIPGDGADGDGPVYLEDHGDTGLVSPSLRDLLAWRVAVDG